MKSNFKSKVFDNSTLFFVYQYLKWKNEQSCRKMAITGWLEIISTAKIILKVFYSVVLLAKAVNFIIHAFLMKINCFVMIAFKKFKFILNHSLRVIKMLCLCFLNLISHHMT